MFQEQTDVQIHATANNYAYHTRAIIFLFGKLYDKQPVTEPGFNPSVWTIAIRNSSFLSEDVWI